ncbi:CaiB/BaiF CoA transferase family protein [Paraburkholderia sp. BR14374]|uniref:CaiB/BaiF CoA transferase family protein n=1 Tax=Paraburkholderia sp. BR14374 TaxID=3237007 RepID=UPI0034CE6F75
MPVSDSIGPGPFCGMLFSDMGADVIRIDRKGANAGRMSRLEIDRRGRRSVSLDLKRPESVAACLALCEAADVVFEGYRPGVMERLGLGPDEMLKRNPRIVYGRMTGWGQYGPYAHRAGHDINYIAITGALDAIGTKDRPVPPLSLVGDYAGGAMMLAVGLLSAVLHARSTGQGQVVDAAISDGSSYLMAAFYGLRAQGRWQEQRAANLIDGGAPFYDTYRCADGRFIAIGAIEPQFYSLLLEKIGLAGKLPNEQMDRAAWPAIKATFAEIFATKTRDQWVEIMGDADTCFAPVLTADEATQDPHNVARSTFVEIDGVRQPAPAPRFSRTPAAIQASGTSAAVRSLLQDWGLPQQYVDQLADTAKV